MDSISIETLKTLQKQAAQKQKENEQEEFEELVHRMSPKQLREMLIKMRQQMLAQEETYKKLIAHQWGFGEAPKL